MKRLLPLITLVLFIKFTTQAQTVTTFLNGLTSKPTCVQAGDYTLFTGLFNGNIIKSEISFNAPSTNLLVDLPNSIHSMALYGDHLYFTVTGDTKLYKINTTETSPSVTEFLSTTNSLGGIEIVNNFIYFVGMSDGSVLRANLNDTNPAAETLLTGYNFTHDITLIGDYLYFIDNFLNIYRFNINDEIPTPEWVLTEPDAAKLEGAGNNLFITVNIQNKIVKVDLSQPTFNAVDYATSLAWPMSMSYYGNTIYIAEYNGFEVSKIDNLLTTKSVTANHINLYPNPAQDYITISGIEEPLTYSIYTIDGKLVMQGVIKPKEHINLSQLSPGAYILKGHNGNIQKKIVIM